MTASCSSASLTAGAKAAPTASPRWATKAVAAATGPAFELHSKPGSNRVIYLDFDGHTITGTAWNGDGKPATVNVTAYDTDGNTGNWSTAEQDVVRDVWTRVAEDYAPFDVDVTTQAPAESAITRSGSSDQQYGTRVVIDPTTWYQSGCGCGGVAYVGVYDDASRHSYYQPALVFTKGVGTGAKNIAEAAAHEAGHNIGLSHDGTASVGYYTGHGAWAPIMGVGYSKAISQWSKGEYSGANNKEDDFAVAGQNGLALRADDHGNDDRRRDRARARYRGVRRLRQRLRRRRVPDRPERGHVHFAANVGSGRPGHQAPAARLGRQRRRHRRPGLRPDRTRRPRPV